MDSGTMKYSRSFCIQKNRNTQLTEFHTGNCILISETGTDSVTIVRKLQNISLRTATSSYEKGSDARAFIKSTRNIFCLKNHPSSWPSLRFLAWIECRSRGHFQQHHTGRQYNRSYRSHCRKRAIYIYLMTLDLKINDRCRNSARREMKLEHISLRPATS